MVCYFTNEKIIQSLTGHFNQTKVSATLVAKEMVDKFRM